MESTSIFFSFPVLESPSTIKFQLHETWFLQINYGISWSVYFVCVKLFWSTCSFSPSICLLTVFDFFAKFFIWLFIFSLFVKKDPVCNFLTSFHCQCALLFPSNHCVGFILVEYSVVFPPDNTNNWCNILIVHFKSFTKNGYNW